MKKWFVVLSAALLTVFLSASYSCAADGDLAYLAKDHNKVKVYLKNFANTSGQAEISADEFKKSFEITLLRRKAVTFATVSSADASNIQISCDIKKYMYSKTDPINSFAGTPGVVLDAVTAQNYAELTGEFTVVDTKSGKIIWKNSVMGFVEGKMTPEESIPLVYNKLARQFLWKSFGKPNKLR